jgi:Na+/proline symporter
MHLLDWIVLAATLAAIVGYGVLKTSRREAGELLSGSKDVSRLTIGLGIMATQASAITFLSTPGQAYAEDMGFIQFYFGLPLAVILVSAFFVPAYRKMSAITAYQFLEQRFDRKTRLFTAALFLMSRGLAAGITIFAPAIVLSAALGCIAQSYDCHHRAHCSLLHGQWRFRGCGCNTEMANADHPCRNGDCGLFIGR